MSRYTVKPGEWVTPDETTGSIQNTSYLINQYWELAEFIKPQFGTYNYFGGNGTTTFAVPDLRGEFLRMTGTNNHTNQGSGSAVGEHQDGTEHTVFVSGIPNSELRIRNCEASSYAQLDDVNRDSSLNGNKNQSSLTVEAVSNSNVTADYAFTSRPTNTSVLYCIKYTNSPSMQPSNVYSIEEKRIGTWIDGKPLYQIIVHMTSPSTVNTGTNYEYDLSNIGLNISNLDLKNMDGFLVGSVAPYHWRNINFSFSYGTNDVCTYFHDNIIHVNVTNAAYTNCDMYITLKYTKV